jgi:hypothetical protein
VPLALGVALAVAAIGVVQMGIFPIFPLDPAQLVVASGAAR